MNENACEDAGAVVKGDVTGKRLRSVQSFWPCTLLLYLSLVRDGSLSEVGSHLFSRGGYIAGTQTGT